MIAEFYMLVKDRLDIPILHTWMLSNYTSYTRSGMQESQGKCLWDSLISKVFGYQSVKFRQGHIDPNSKLSNCGLYDKVWGVLELND